MVFVSATTLAFVVWDTLEHLAIFLFAIQRIQQILRYAVEEEIAHQQIAHVLLDFLGMIVKM
jgi:hypothetical protein